MWQRYGVSIADKRYAHGVTVHGHSSVTIDLNRQCASYDALVGVDDLTLGLGKVRFSVYGDGVRLWRSGLVRGGDPAVPVHVDLTGRRDGPAGRGAARPVGPAALADWAESQVQLSPVTGVPAGVGGAAVSGPCARSVRASVGGVGRARGVFGLVAGRGPGRCGRRSPRVRACRARSGIGRGWPPRQLVGGGEQAYRARVVAQAGQYGPRRCRPWPP